MSQINVDTITDEAGTGSPALPYGIGADTITNAAGTGAPSFPSGMSITEVIEKITTVETTSATINFDALGGAVHYYTVAQTANRTINFRGDVSTALNAVMAISESMTFAVLMTQTGTAYYLDAYEVDGVSVTPKWQGGTAPDAGNINSIDSYGFTIIKTADATFTVLASQTQFA